MLLHKAPDNRPFNNPNWYSQLKLDGIRVILEKINGAIRLYTRHHTDITSKYKQFQLLDIPDNTILDGELIVTDENGHPDFEAVMQTFSSSKSKHNVSIVAFDILQYKGVNLIHLPLSERKVFLEEAIPDNKQLLSRISFFEGDNASALYDLVKEKSLEGIVLKDKNGKYLKNSRSRDNLKVINYSYENVWIGGYRKKEFGWLLQFENGKPAGFMELGVPKEAKLAFYKISPSIEIKEDKNFVYVEPVISCHTKFRNITKKGLLRLPSFVKFNGI